jgi:hypothetical protein
MVKECTGLKPRKKIVERRMGYLGGNGVYAASNDH